MQHSFVISTETKEARAVINILQEKRIVQKFKDIFYIDKHKLVDTVVVNSRLVVYITKAYDIEK